MSKDTQHYNIWCIAVIKLIVVKLCYETDPKPWTLNHHDHPYKCDGDIPAKTHGKACFS